MASKERENFYKNSALIVDHAKDSLVDVLELHLTLRSLSFEDFINLHQHDIYHLCFNKRRCCQCSHGYVLPHNRVLYPSQLEILLDKYGVARPCHVPGRRADFCCCLAKPGVTTNVLDITLARCLLINFCDDVFRRSSSLQNNIDTLLQMRNNVYGHAKEGRITDVNYRTYKNKIESAILEIAKVCGNETEKKQILMDVEKRSLDETLCIQYHNTLLEQIAKETQLEEKLNDLAEKIPEIVGKAVVTALDGDTEQMLTKDNPFPVHTSNQGRTNYARISIVVVDVFPNILREIMRSNIKPEVLNRQIITQLKNYPSVFNTMTREERVSLNTLTNSTYDNIDFITLYKLMRTFLLPNKPTQGWGKPPTNADVTISDDVERLRFVRNKIVHRIKADIDLIEMRNYFSNIVNITQRIDTYLGKLPDQGFTREVYNIQTCCMDSETEQKYYQALKDIEDIKEKFSDQNVHIYYGKMFSNLIQDVQNKAKSSEIPISLVLEDINDGEKRRMLNELKTEINSGLVNIKFKQSDISEMTKLDQEFRLLLSQISDKLSTEDIRSLGFLLGHQIPVQDLENVKTGEDIFELMLKHGLLSKTNTDFLSKMLEDKNLSPCVELLQTFNTDNEEELKKQEEDPQSPMMGTSDEIKVDKELLSKGTYISYENCVYLGGACNVGKSTLASILIGEAIPQHWKSTDGLTIYFGRNGIHLKNKEMVPLKQDFHADVLSKVLRGKPEKPDTTHREEVLPHDSNKGNIIPETHIDTQRTDITAPTPSLVPGTGKDDVNITDPVRQQSPQNYIITTIEKDIKEEIRKGTYKIEIAPSDLVDFGGQRSFDMTHQLFMRRKGTFVLMFNGRIDFSVPLEEYKQGETTESILKHWVNSILSYCVDDDDILPIIMFCATHSDDFNQEDRNDRKKKLIHDLREIFKNHKRQHRIIYDDIFFINGQDKNDLEINKLKSKLVEVACKQKSWGKRMPMAYVPLALQMSELRLHNMSIISKEELITLNKRNEELALTDERIKHFLNDQHSLGKIVYFDQHGLDNFINLQPQSLVNILRSFITAECFWPEDKELKGILRALTDTGKIAKQDLLKLWSQKKFHQHMPNDDFKEFIIQVLIHLDILVEPRHHRQEQESKVQSYLVPCIVKRRLPVNDFNVKSADKMICLSYTLLKSSMPAALCFKLIGAAINVWPLKETPEGICLYHQAAILCIDGSNELHLLVEDDKVFVYLINKVAKRFIPPNIASVVQECLTLTMTKVLEFYHKSFGKALSTFEVSKVFEIEVGEWCTSGGGCYISVPKVKEKREWLCENEQTHQTKCPLYWIWNKKQVECDEKCPGLDKEGLKLHPEDKHFFRLANLITLDECYRVVTMLGLSEITWNDIQNTDKYVKRGVALCKWRYQKEKNMSEPSFQDLFDALAPEKKTHALCQLFMEDVKVYGDANSALQEIPEDDVLQDLSKEVGNCAIHLGVELGLSMAAIEGILFKHEKSIFEQTFGVMKEWKRSSKVRPTILMLMKVFQSADGRGLMFLRKKYIDNQAGDMTSCSPVSSSNNISTGNDQRGQGYQSSIEIDPEPYISSVNNKRVHDLENKTDIYDGVVLHAEDDRDTAIEFITNMERECPDLNIKITIYENLMLGTSLLGSAAKLFDSCRYLFVFVTQNFVKADIENFLLDSATIETLTSQEKKARLIPVKADKTHLSTLTPLKSLKYYHYLEAKESQQGPDRHFIEGFVKLINNGRKEYLVN